MIAAVLAVLAVLLISVVLTAVAVTVLGDVVGHPRGARGLPTCRRAGSDLVALTRRVTSPLRSGSDQRTRS